jgi:CheY-like chemotaxis protein
MERGRLVILLVEDDDNDIFFVRRATEAGGHSLFGVHNGEEAVLYMKGFGEFADREKFPIPNVVLTDLKMPRMDGLELLRWIRSNPRYGVIPTMVYSSSHLESDISQAYALGANAYLAKPSNLKELIEILRLTYEFWSKCERPTFSLRESSSA